MDDKMLHYIAQPHVHVMLTRVLVMLLQDQGMDSSPDAANDVLVEICKSDGLASGDHEPITHRDLKLTMQFLMGLSEAAFEEFCIGDINENTPVMKRLRKRPGFTAAHRTVDAMFMYVGG